MHVQRLPVPTSADTTRYELRCDASVVLKVRKEDFAHQPYAAGQEMLKLTQRFFVDHIDAAVRDIYFAKHSCYRDPAIERIAGEFFFNIDREDQTAQLTLISPYDSADKAYIRGTSLHMRFFREQPIIAVLPLNEGEYKDSIRANVQATVVAQEMGKFEHLVDVLAHALPSAVEIQGYEGWSVGEGGLTERMKCNVTPLVRVDPAAQKRLFR